MVEHPWVDYNGEEGGRKRNFGEAGGGYPMARPEAGSKKQAMDHGKARFTLVPVGIGAVPARRRLKV